MFAEKAIGYFHHVKPPETLPNGIDLMNPYKDSEVISIINTFYTRFYNDEKRRLFIFGINPGRFGGGLTGISFTDPVSLRSFCGLENNMGNKRELSSEFIYKMIEQYGGVSEFFSRCYLTAIFPFALLKEDKNYNFYDDKITLDSLMPFMKKSVLTQSGFGARNDRVISLGLKNAVILKAINDELKLFKKIEILEHPRFIMQYKRKSLADYIDKYISVLK
jgi:hypothetical protein